MKMDRRLSNGLAWAGALLVIGIPAADYLTGTFAGAPSLAVVDAAPVAAADTAAVVPKPAPAVQVAEAPKPAPKPVPAPVAKPQAATGAADPVSGFLQSGKELPSYITGGDAQTAAVPAKPPAQPQVIAPVAPKPTEVATTPPPAEQVAVLPATAAPTPMPLSMRPQPVSVPLASDQPLIIDQAATRPGIPAPQPNDFLTSEDLEDWESGPLSEFLAKRGQQSSATYRVQQNVPPPPPQAEGFWLDEGPQGDRPIRRYQPIDDEIYYLPF